MNPGQPPQRTWRGKSLDASLNEWRNESEEEPDVAELLAGNEALRKELAAAQSQRHGHLSQIRELRAELHVAATSQAMVEALEQQVAAQGQAMEALEQECHDLRRSRVDAEEAFRERDNELRGRLGSSTSELAALRGRVVACDLEAANLRASNRVLQGSLNKQTSTVQILESRLCALSKLIEKQGKVEEYVHILSDEVLAWEHQEGLLGVSAEDHEFALRMLRRAHAKETRELETLRQQVGTLEVALQAQEQRQTLLREEKGDLQARLDRTEQQLGVHKTISQEKLASVVTKYTTIKNINSALERRVLDLLGEVERLREALVRRGQEASAPPADRPG